VSNLKTRQKEESRQNILNAASKLFREKGYQATGVDELMEKAGLTAGAFYAHFKSKKELLLESLRYGLEKNRGRLLAGTENQQGLPFVKTVLGRYVSETHRDNPQSGCPLPAMAAELYRSADETKEIVSLYLEEWVKILSPALPGSKDEKRAEALRLISQAVGGILLSRMAELELSKEILKAAREVLD
jgi:TetR/AcrR family transcriptional repressor of nem operon